MGYNQCQFCSESFFVPDWVDTLVRCPHCGSSPPEPTATPPTKSESPPPQPTAKKYFSLRPQYELEPWQNEAVDCWLNANPQQGKRHGIFEIFTGAGKTVLAAAIASRISQEDDDMHFAIIVPKIALADQWREEIPKVTDINPDLVGVFHGQEKHSFEQKRILIFVINSAQKMIDGKSTLADMAAGKQLTLIVDECHSSGANKAKNIFDVDAIYKLGLSATPERSDEFDEDGLPILLHQQPHGQALGPICYSLSLMEGVRRGLLPRFEVHHHAIELNEEEKSSYDQLTSNINDAGNQIERLGGNRNKYLSYIRYRKASEKVITAAKILQQALLARKSFLYTASERLRITTRLVIDAWQNTPAPQGAILFNQLIGEKISDTDENELKNEALHGTENLHKRIIECCHSGSLPFAASQAAIEHSGCTTEQREKAVRGLKDGSVKVLCTVKALQEGVNVPDVTLGISVASTANSRQRIQTMGRILRPKRDQNGRRIPREQTPVKKLHLLYVRSTTDEEIYRKKDWNKETGGEPNEWWCWELGADEPYPGDPLAPLIVSEEEAWARIASQALPAKWDGPTNGLLLTHKQDAHRQNSIFPSSNHHLPVHNADQIMPLLNHAETLGCIDDARGKFMATPNCHVIIKQGPSDIDPNERIYWAIGKLNERPRWQGAETLVSTPDNQAPEPPQSTPNQLPHAASSQEQGSGGPSGSDHWYVLLQRACMGAVQGDTDLIIDAANKLSQRGDGAGRAAAKEACDYLTNRTTAPKPSEQPPEPRVDLYPPYFAAAFQHRRIDLLKKARNQWAPTAKKKKPKRLAILRCLQLLLGETTSIFDPVNAPEDPDE